MPPIKNKITCQIPILVFPAIMLPRPGRIKRFSKNPIIAMPVEIFSLLLLIDDILVTLYFGLLCFFDFAIFSLFYVMDIKNRIRNYFRILLRIKEKNNQKV